jgi:hypothetical protein
MLGWLFFGARSKCPKSTRPPPSHTHHQHKMLKFGLRDLGYRCSWHFSLMHLSLGHFGFRTFCP